MSPVRHVLMSPDRSVMAADSTEAELSLTLSVSSTATTRT